MVQYVERLSMEVELTVFHDFEVLVEACIEVLDAGCRALVNAHCRVAQEQPLTGSGEWRGNATFKSVARPDEFAGIQPSDAEFASSGHGNTLAAREQRAPAGIVCVATGRTAVILVAVIIADAAITSGTCGSR